MYLDIRHFGGLIFMSVFNLVQIQIKKLDLENLNVGK